MPVASKRPREEVVASAAEQNGEVVVPVSEAAEPAVEEDPEVVAKRAEEEEAMKAALEAANQAKEMEFYSVFDTDSINVPRLEISGAIVPAPSGAVPLSTPFYAFAADAATKCVDEAFGVEIDAEGAATIKIAFIDIQRLIPAADQIPLIENYAAIVVDYFGMYKRAVCSFLGRCNRPKCSFSHGPTGPQCHQSSVRCCPPKYRRIGAGFSAEHVRPAIVVTLKGEEAPVVTREWVKLCPEWRITSVADVPSETPAAEHVGALVALATRVSGADRFKRLFKGPAVFLSGAPMYVDFLKASAPDRPFLDLEGFVAETLIGVCNEALLAFIRDSKPTAPIAAVKVSTTTLPADVTDALAAGGLTTSSHSYALLDSYAATPAHIAAALKHPQHHEFVFADAEDLLPEGQKGCGLTMVKFNSPLDSLQSLHNQLVLARVMGECSNVSVLSKYKSRSAAIAGRLKLILRKQMAAGPLLSSPLREVGLRSLEGGSQLLVLGADTIRLAEDEAPSKLPVVQLA